MRILLVATLAAMVAAPSFADETTGVITHFDPVKRTMTLADKTVWQVTLDEEAVKGIQSGQKVRIAFDTAGEDGITKIRSITRM